MALNLEKMSTETRNPDTMNLDEMSALEIITQMNLEDAKISAAIAGELDKIALVIEYAVESLKKGGRIFYIGAGTSGRLGVLDASECPPTFGVSPDVVVGLIAGGDSAFIKAVEGAEDSMTLAEEDLRNRNLCPEDIVIGLASSGRTPYVIGGLEYAKKVGCHTAAIANNQNSEIGKIAEVAIEVIVGPEILTGSTRLKSGTAQKMILNMISTASMIRIGKVYQNLMVDVMQTNEKLRRRAEKIVTEATGVTVSEARKYIDEAQGSCKVAITMILADCNYEEAQRRLYQSHGHVRAAIRQ